VSEKGRSALLASSNKPILPKNRLTYKILLKQKLKV
jgi:hypothetical protein